MFTPGFSTAAEVSEISGRGVGLDVVKNNIQELKGTIDVITRSARERRSGSRCRSRWPSSRP